MLLEFGDCAGKAGLEGLGGGCDGVSSAGCSKFQLDEYVGW